ncbi:MAG: winged helix DNA-binding domain-containing protein [Acidimicrobiia bacterium]|nr:winged helix DNA-binding domain-containing protein [Acidimicrobiia bacterium]
MTRASAAPSPHSTTSVTRAEVLAYRCRAQGLDRASADVRQLTVWDLGLQDTPSGSAAMSLAARLPGGAGAVPDLGDARSWLSVWATRGAPVVLRAGDERAFAQALWPVDAADAVARLAGNGQQLKKAQVDPIEAIRVTAEAMRSVVEGTMPKGEVSTEVTKLLPESYITWCRPCNAHHLGDQLMRLSGLPAGTRLVQGADRATLAPIAGWPGVPTAAAGTDRLVRAYLGLNGPATAGEVAAFLGTNQKAIKASWPAEELVAVTVDGAKAWLAEADLDMLLEARVPDLVRLLPRCDPWMLARDRSLIVPDKAHQKVLWPVLGAPGAVLADGEVVAAWRTRASGKRVTLTVQAFDRLTKRVRAAVEEEAANVAQLRGVADLEVVLADA